MTTVGKWFSNRVIVIDSSGENRGEMSIKDAKILAESQGLDLVEVSKQNNLSVCKIINEGKWNYEQKKKQKKSHSHAHELKEIKFTTRIAEHDLNIKINNIKKLLDKGHPVKVIVELKGREKYNTLGGEEKMESILSRLEEFSVISDKTKNAEGGFLKLSALLRLAKK